MNTALIFTVGFFIGLWLLKILFVKKKSKSTGR